MRKGIMGILVIGVLVGFLTVSLAGPPDVIKIEHKYTAKKKGPVTLSHTKHVKEYKVACTECHHKWQKEKEKQPKKCSDCHKEKKEGKVLSLKRAFHKNCMGCHKNLAKQGKKTGPTTKCSKCHAKKAK